MKCTLKLNVQYFHFFSKSYLNFNFVLFCIYKLVLNFQVYWLSSFLFVIDFQFNCFVDWQHGLYGTRFLKYLQNCFIGLAHMINFYICVWLKIINIINFVGPCSKYFHSVKMLNCIVHIFCILTFIYSVIKIIGND